MGNAPSNGTYFIQSVAYNTQVITLRPFGIVVASHRTNHPNNQKWIVENITVNGGNVTSTVKNFATKQYLAMDATGHKLVVSGNIFPWYIREIQGPQWKHYVISPNNSYTGAVQLLSHSDGAVIAYANYNKLPIQQWDLRKA